MKSGKNIMTARLSRIFVINLIFCFIGGLSFAWIMHPPHAQKKWQLTAVAGHLPDLRFSLVADSGQIVTEKNYRGDVVLLYFGFTTCADECPTTLLRLRRMMERLGRDASHIRVLFVTVDPKNDTPPILHQYLAAFDQEYMTGLTGGAGDLEALAKRYRVADRAVHGEADDISHGNVIYIFDRVGEARLLATPEDTDEKILSDVRRLFHDAS